MWLLFTSLLVQAAVQPAPAAVQPFAESGFWTVLKNPASADCRMIAHYEHGTMFVVYFSLASGRADVMFANEKWKSLAAGQKKKLELTFFPQGRWAKGEGGVVTSKSDDSVALSLGFTDGRNILKYLAEAKSFSLTADGVSLGISNLDGSRQAVESLKTCAAEAFAEGAQGDPFAPTVGPKSDPKGVSTLQHSNASERKTWLQLTRLRSHDRTAVHKELQNLREKGGGLFEGLAFNLERTVEGYRVLIGPFRSLTEANLFAGDVRRRNLPAELWVSQAGAPIEKIPAP